jgi:hypothetical protein
VNQVFQLICPKIQVSSQVSPWLMPSRFFAWKPIEKCVNFGPQFGTCPTLVTIICHVIWPQIMGKWEEAWCTHAPTQSSWIGILIYVLGFRVCVWPCQPTTWLNLFLNCVMLPWKKKLKYHSSNDHSPNQILEQEQQQ